MVLLQGVNHPLGFTWHPLEGAGVYIYICYMVVFGYIRTRFFKSFFPWISRFQAGKGEFQFGSSHVTT